MLDLLNVLDLAFFVRVTNGKRNADVAVGILDRLLANHSLKRQAQEPGSPRNGGDHSCVGQGIFPGWRTSLFY